MTAAHFCAQRGKGEKPRRAARKPMPRVASKVGALAADLATPSRATAFNQRRYSVYRAAAQKCAPGGSEKSFQFRGCARKASAAVCGRNALEARPTPPALTFRSGRARSVEGVRCVNRPAIGARFFAEACDFFGLLEAVMAELAERLQFAAEEKGRVAVVPVLVVCDRRRHRVAALQVESAERFDGQLMGPPALPCLGVIKLVVLRHYAGRANAS